jgi:hypothetical protein
MPLYRLEGPDAFDAPVIVAAFDGWVDAGAVATAAPRPEDAPVTRATWPSRKQAVTRPPWRGR